MGQLLFFDALLIGSGPLLFVYLYLIHARSFYILLMIGSTIFFLFGYLVLSLVWYVVRPLNFAYWQMIILSVIVQEAFRHIFYYLYCYGENNIAEADRGTGFTRQQNYFRMAVAVG